MVVGREKLGGIGYENEPMLFKKGGETEVDGKG